LARKPNGRFERAPRERPSAEQWEKRRQAKAAARTKTQPEDAKAASAPSAIDGKA
jgi:hypothetical protein